MSMIMIRRHAHVLLISQYWLLRVNIHSKSLESLDHRLPWLTCTTSPPPSPPHLAVFTYLHASPTATCHSPPVITHGCMYIYIYSCFRQLPPASRHIPCICLSAMLYVVGSMDASRACMYSCIECSFRVSYWAPMLIGTGYQKMTKAIL